MTGVILLAGFAGVNALAYRHAYAMLHFSNAKERTDHPEALTWRQKISVLLSGVDLPRPKSQSSSLALGSDARAITIECENHIRLGAWYCAGPKPGPLAILFHGYGSEKSSLVPAARAFLEMGCSVLLVDFRGSGDSSESYTTIGFCEGDDVAAAVAYANKHIPHSSLVLYGQSMGAAAVLRAISVHGVNPDAIILEAVFDNLLTTIRNRFSAMRLPSFPGAELLAFWGGRQFGFNAFSHNPSQYAASVHCPTLFLHGDNDPRARVSEARRVFDAIPARKQFEQFAGARHEPLLEYSPMRWKAVVSQFIAHTSTVAPEMPQPRINTNVHE